MDIKAGENCVINGKNAYNIFGADLASVDEDRKNVTLDYRLNTGKSGVKINQYEHPASKIKLRFYVYGSTLSECINRVNSLIAECKECVISIGENIMYNGTLSQYESKKIDIDFYYDVSLTILCVPVLSKRTVTESMATAHTKTITNSGVVESGLKITIKTSSYTASNVTICGVTIKTLAANSTYIIDGIAGEVTKNGTNDFLNVTLIDFPKIQAGTNNIAIPVVRNGTISFEYYPTLLV